REGGHLDALGQIEHEPGASLVAPESRISGDRKLRRRGRIGNTPAGPGNQQSAEQAECRTFCDGPHGCFPFAPYLLHQAATVNRRLTELSTIRHSVAVA